MQVSISADPPCAQPGDTVFFSSQVSGGDSATYSYTWDFGGASGYLDAVSQTYPEEGLHEVMLTVEDGSGNSGWAYIELEVGDCDEIRASIAASPHCVEIGENISFSAEVTGGDKSSYEYSWNLGNGNITNSSKPVHAYGYEKDYPVTLVVRDKNNLMEKVETVVQVGDCEENDDTEDNDTNTSETTTSTTMSIAEDDLPVFTEKEFDRCVFGPGMECSTNTWLESDLSVADGICGDFGAGAQVVELVVHYYKNTDAANAYFQYKIDRINESISYYDGGCPDSDTCRLLDSEEESSEIGYLGYRTNNDYLEHYSGGYTLLYGNYYASFELFGNTELMNQEQAEQYYATAKECLKNIVMKKPKGFGGLFPNKKLDTSMKNRLDGSKVCGSDRQELF